MKTNLFLSLFFFIFFVSCKMDDSSVFPSMQDRIQNEGYYPLAPDNSWLYEERVATLESDGTTYLYEKGNPKKIESVITKTSQVTGEDGKSRFDYGFSPIDVAPLGGFIGGMIGSFNQIAKINGDYFKKQTVTYEKAGGNGSTSPSSRLELENQKFLVDNPQPGQVISFIEDSFSSPDQAIKVDYSVTTTVVDVLDQMPDNLTNNVGIDDQLKQYTNILHTREVVFIKKITLKAENARIELNTEIAINELVNINAYVDTSGVDIKGKIRFGNLTQLLQLFFPEFIDLYAFGVNIWGNNIRLVFSTYSDIKICPSTIKINLNSSLNGAPFDLVSNQDLMYTDQYWVKGVGNIKNITKYGKPLNLKIEFKDYLFTDPITVKLQPIDPACGVDIKDPNAISVDTSLQLSVDGLQLELPLNLSENITIQNLKSHIQRKTLN